MRVGIIGAGPAGVMCALRLLRDGAFRRGAGNRVWLFDGKQFARVGPQGCNMCAGVVGDRVLCALHGVGLELPESIILQHIHGHRFVTRFGSVAIPKEPESTLYAVFRSAGPRGSRPEAERSFDAFLLQAALQRGAEHVPSYVVAVERPQAAGQRFRLRTADGHCWEVDVLVGAFGINSTLVHLFESMGFGYRAPAMYRVRQADVPLPVDFVSEIYRNEIKVFSLGLPGIRFAALTPKGSHVTITVIGRQLTLDHLRCFLRDRLVRAYFPEGWSLPSRFCHCSPRLPVTAARHPVADRLILVGDANVSRYLKGGIESAFFTGAWAAEMILAGALSRQELERDFVHRCHVQYRDDNVYGALLFALNDVLSHAPALGALGIRYLQREQGVGDWHRRPHTQVLWHAFAGDAPYRHIAAQAMRAVAAPIVGARKLPAIRSAEETRHAAVA